MKLTNSQIAEAVPGMKDLAALEMSAKTSFKIAKAIELLAPISRAFDEARQKLAEKYGKRDDKGELLMEEVEGGTQYQIGDAEGFNDEFSDLLEVENDVPLDQIPFTEIEDIKVKPGTLLVLSWLFSEEPTSSSCPAP